MLKNVPEKTGVRDAIDADAVVQDGTPGNVGVSASLSCSLPVFRTVVSDGMSRQHEGYIAARLYMQSPRSEVGASDQRNGYPAWSDSGGVAGQGIPAFRAVAAVGRARHGSDQDAGQGCTGTSRNTAGADEAGHFADAQAWQEAESPRTCL